jgi:tetratricopeptide (TPR) repeat protein
VLGIQLFKRKAYKEAISPLIEASSFAVDRAEVYTFVGFAYDGLSDYQNAITYFTKALDENHYTIKLTEVVRGPIGALTNTALPKAITHAR